MAQNLAVSRKPDAGAGGGGVHLPQRVRYESGRHHRSGRRGTSYVESRLGLFVPNGELRRFHAVLNAAPVPALPAGISQNTVTQGNNQFVNIGCGACASPQHTTGPGGEAPGDESGSSAVFDLQLALAYDWAADLEKSVGNGGMSKAIAPRRPN